jgi:lysophospholipase L1-like esterase
MIGRRALLAAPLLLAPSAAFARLPVAAQPVARPDAWWRTRHEAKLAELARVKPDLIWLGDSITHNFERNEGPDWARFAPVWQRYYAPRKAVNLGYGGDATCHLLWRQMNGELAGIAPKAAVILIGANNLGRLHWAAEASVLGIETVVQEARRRLPHTNILVLSILPSVRSPWVTETTNTINAALAPRLKGVDRVGFQDVSPVFMRAGAVDRGLYLDPFLVPPEPPLHPTADGMARLAAAIEPTLAGLMRA